MAAVQAGAPLTMKWCLDCHGTLRCTCGPSSPSRTWSGKHRRKGRRIFCAIAVASSRRSIARAATGDGRAVDDPIWRGPGERVGLGGEPGEFPEGGDAAPDLSRRSLLQLLGASAALAGASGCSRGPPEDIVPYVEQPPEVRPSVPSRYATTMALGGYGVGMIVESHEGRPTKAEGNPRHPASLGALGTFEQASVLSLYDPARPKALTFRGQPATWEAFVEAVAAPQPAGKRIHVLAEPTGAPHVTARTSCGACGAVETRRCTSGPPWRGRTCGRDRGSRSAGWSSLGGILPEADVVVSLDADFLAAAATPPAWARAWAGRSRDRRPDGGDEPALRGRGAPLGDRHGRRRAARRGGPASVGGGDGGGGGGPLSRRGRWARHGGSPPRVLGAPRVRARRVGERPSPETSTPIAGEGSSSSGTASRRRSTRSRTR